MDTRQGRLPQLGVGVSVGGDSVFNEGFLQEMSLLFAADSLSIANQAVKKRRRSFSRRTASSFSTVSSQISFFFFNKCI